MGTTRSAPGWLVTAGWVVLGVAAVGLPTALVVALLDTVRRTGSPAAQQVLVGGLVVLAVVLVIAAERGVSWAAREGALGWALGIVGVLAALVVLGVVVPTLGLVLTGLGVVLGLPAALAGIGAVVWWRWRNGPRPAARSEPDLGAVRERAEARRSVVRARHERTREAVRRGYVGPGFTRGR